MDTGLKEDYDVRAIGSKRDMNAESQREKRTRIDEDFKTADEQSQPVLLRLDACLVSMGYQVNHYVMHSERFDSYWKRSITIVSIAAPGLNTIL